MRGALVLTLAACRATATDTTSADARESATVDAGDDGPAPRADGPYTIGCTLYHRDLAAGETQHQSARITLASDTDGIQSTTLRGVTFEMALAAVAGDPDHALLRLSVREAGVTQELRMHRLRLPSYEYAGSHGFTGLMYVPVDGADVQYICIAGNPLETPSGPIDPDVSVPIHARCVVRHHGPPDAGAPTDDERMIELTAAGQTRVDFLDGAVRLSLGDDPRSVRTVVVQITPSSATAGGGFWAQQALQLYRSKPLPNAFGPEHGITGRVSAALPNGEAVSYACSSVE